MLPVVASRKAIPSPRRRYMRLSLLGSAVAAVVAGFGGQWLLPIGLVLAVAGGVLASTLAWREVRVTRTTLRAEQRADAQRASELMQQATRQHVGVVKLLSARNGELLHQLELSRSVSANLTRDTAQLRGDKVALRFELNQRNHELSVVRQRLEAVQAALEEDVVSLPVRDFEMFAGEDLWTENGFPTVVQLEALANPPLPLADERKHA